MSGASPAHHIHARTQDRRVARAASVLRAQPLSPAPRQRRGGLHGQTERLSAHAGSTQIAGSSQQSGGVRWPPVVAGTQAEVRSGEGKGGGSPARAGRCALRCGRCGGRKEPSPRCVRGLRASWAAAMATLLGTRRPRGWRKGGAAAGETGARIGGARAAGSGAAKPPSQPSVGAGRAGDLEGTELWPLRAVHISAGGGGELYIAVPAGRTA